MKDIVGPAAKLGGQMVKGVKPFDAEAAAKAMNEISGVPDKYVKLFPKGTEHGAIADSEAKPAIWEDFAKFEATAKKLKDASAKAASAAAEGEAAFAAAFKDMTSVCKECHETFREKRIGSTHGNGQRFREAALRRALLALLALAVAGAVVFYLLTMPPATEPASALPAHTPDLANGKYMFTAGGLRRMPRRAGEKMRRSSKPKTR